MVVCGKWELAFETAIKHNTFSHVNPNYRQGTFRGH